MPAAVTSLQGATTEDEAGGPQHRDLLAGGPCLSPGVQTVVAGLRNVSWPRNFADACESGQLSGGDLLHAELDDHRRLFLEKILAELLERHGGVPKMGCEAWQNWRRLRALTAAEVADRAGVGVNTVLRLENGDGATLESVLRVARALGVLDALIDAVDPYATDVGRLRAAEALPARVRHRSSP